MHADLHHKPNMQYKHPAYHKACLRKSGLFVPDVRNLEFKARLCHNLSPVPLRLKLHHSLYFCRTATPCYQKYDSSIFHWVRIYKLSDQLYSCKYIGYPQLERIKITCKECRSTMYLDWMQSKSFSTV